MSPDLSPPPTAVRVGLGARAYDVLIGSGLIANAGPRIKALAPGARVAIVTDENVAPLHEPRLSASLAAAGVGAHTIVLPAGEQTKSFPYLAQLCEQLIGLNLERRDLVVALGGGVIGDLAGLAAGLVKRGLDYVQIPTSLLAQVDSSVGGKTAIDTPQGKNLVGLFHQPRLVLADLDAIATLPVRERRCGFAEIIKYGLINDPAFFAWCDTNAEAVMRADPEALTYAVHKSVAAKAAIVEQDEREAGPRALLNLGHTFAHALETSAGHDDVLKHGEAVATGMAMALRFSARMGLAPSQDAAATAAALARAGLEPDPARLPGGPFDAATMLGHMRQDKKAEGGRITLILARAIGQAFVEKRADETALLQFLQEDLKARP
jgi:3-dehydroquinate synthase